MRESGATEPTRRNQRLIVGPWSHTANLTRQVGQVDFGPEAEVDYFSLIVPWFDHWLKGERNGVMDGPPVRLFVMGANTWRDEEEWPLRRARMVDFYLDSDGSASSPNGRGSLIRTAPSGELPDHYTYDPRDPVMTLYNQNGHDEPHDLRLLDHRRDVLTYESDPLEKGMEVTGAPVMTLFASSSAPDTDFIVRLVDVHPDGFAQSLCYGIVRARFRNGFDNPELMTPGEPYEFAIELLPTSNLFKPGHRIRVDVTSSDFPNFDRNHNVGEEDWADSKLQAARQTVFHDAVRPSRITLPVVPLG